MTCIVLCKLTTLFYIIICKSAPLRAVSWAAISCSFIKILQRSPNSLLNLTLVWVKCVHLAALHGHAPARFDAPSLRQHFSLRRPSARRLLSATGKVPSVCSPACIAAMYQCEERHLCSTHLKLFF